ASKERLRSSNRMASVGRKAHESAPSASVGRKAHEPAHSHGADAPRSPNSTLMGLTSHARQKVRASKELTSKERNPGLVPRHFAGRVAGAYYFFGCFSVALIPSSSFRSSGGTRLR